MKGKQDERDTREGGGGGGGNQERQAGWQADIAARSYDLDPAVNTEGRRNLITGSPHPHLVDFIFLCARLRRRQRWLCYTFKFPPFFSFSGANLPA